MGKRRRSSRARMRWVAGAVAAVVGLGGIAGALVVVATSRPSVSSDEEIAAATERIKAEAEARRAAEMAEREADIEAQRTRVSAPGDRPLRVLAIGDSLSAGSYVSDPSLSWPNLVAGAVGQATPVELNVEALAGQRVADAVARGVKNAGQDLVLVELGTNDVNETDLAAFSASYEQLLSQVRSSSPDAAIICLTPWQTENRARDYIATIDELCGKTTDISSIFSKPGMRILDGQPYFGGLTPDNFHPGDKGHAAIADAITAWLIVSPS